jgi:hypothetical protein
MEGCAFLAWPLLHFCIPHERRSNESLRIVRRDRFRIVHRGLQRPPKHVVASNAAKRVQHVEVDAVQSIGLVVIDGFVGSVVSVIPVVGRSVESTQL